MTTIVSIVEGDGEVRAVPILLRRLATEAGIYDTVVPPPIRVHRDRFLRNDEEFRRMLLLASAKAGSGTVLIILDADDDCPVTLSQAIQTRARTVVPQTTLSVVIANREFEAWFLAAARSLAGYRGLRSDIEPPMNAEGVRNAKGWLSERIPNGRYHEVTDQSAFAAVFDLIAAKNGSRSFQKLLKEVSAAVT